MITLEIEFLAGRFHANPWDSGTNDGEVEWPPSPWRLLRALVAGWHRSGEAGPRELALFSTVLDRLAEPPVFLLPHATAGHTRHYMPLGTAKGGRAETTLVLDSFIALDRERGPAARAYVMWPHVELSADERRMLTRSCELIGYLGRAESWCSINVSEEVPGELGLHVVDLASRALQDGPTVRRLTAGPSLRGNGLLAALGETTGAMRRARRLMPIGAAWVEYRLPPDFLMAREQYDRPERTRAVFGPVMLRFGLERGARTPRPPIREAVAFADLFRAAAISRLSNREGEPATRRLAGKAEAGGPRAGHDHPYFLPFDSAGRGEIDGIDVWFPQGCTHPEYMAVTSVSELREHVLFEDNYPITFLGQVVRKHSSAWQTATPIVLERFPKVRGSQETRRVIDSPEEQVALMAERATGRVAQVELWPPGRGIEREHGGHIRVDSFRRARLRKRSEPLPVVGATLRFDGPVEGPILMGRLAHFGLGRMEAIPVAADDPSEGIQEGAEATQ